MRAPSKCRACHGRLEEGHTVDKGHGSYHPARWQRGRPERVWYGGIRGNTKTMMEVTTYRCAKCGLLENYAL